MILSVGIVAYNEKENLPILLKQLTEQTIDKGRVELLLIDSCSTDGTKQIFNDFKRDNELYFYGIEILDNPGKIQAAGWNVAIDSFKGDALLRLDAHARIEHDFLQRNLECLETGEMVCGGKRPNLPSSDKPLCKLVALADRSIFGGSAGKYHESEGKKYVDTVFHGCYRKEVIEKVGHFNEKLGRTEDNDFHRRITDAGFKICYDPRICSYQFSRGSVKGDIKQKYANGFWIGRTLDISPKCISPFHFVPFLFVAALAAAVVFGIFVSFLPLWLILGVYFTADIALSIAAVLGEKEKLSVFWLLPVLLFSLHLAYGAGTAVGLLSIIYNDPRKAV